MMKLLSLIVGVAAGTAVGAAIVTLFAPTSGAELVSNLKRGYAEALEAARSASEQRRQELEAELAQMQKKK